MSDPLIQLLGPYNNCLLDFFTDIFDNGLMPWKNTRHRNVIALILGYESLRFLDLHLSISA